MVKIYAILLALGSIGLLVVIFGGTLAENLGHPERDPNLLLGGRGRKLFGGILGFSMGGMAAEFSPLDFSWPVALLIASGSAVLGAIWVGYASRITAAAPAERAGDHPGTG
jgi:hypothetical protein